MVSEIEACPVCAVPEAGEFLAEYTAWLWGCGATAIRIEKNVWRMAEAFGLEVAVALLPHHIELTLRACGTGERTVVIRKMAACGISFDINTRLSRLSWEVADRKIGFREACRRFDQIKETKPTAWWETLLLASLANASFCRLFGGDAVAMAVVFAATLAGFYLKQIMLRNHADVRVTFFCCAFFSAAISVGAEIFKWGDTPDIAIATSVLYLIPGVPYINAASDLIDRHYLCAFGRFCDACVLTAALSAGLATALLLLGIDLF